MPSAPRSLVLCLPILGALAVATAGHASEPVPSKFSREQIEYFEKHVRPLLATHCFECHSHKAKRLEAGLYLDSRDGMLKGGDSGAAVLPGKPAESLLVEAIRYESFEMPPRGRLPKKDVEALVQWIELGAPWPDEPKPTAGTPDAGSTEFDLQARKTAHWAWQPITKPAVPAPGPQPSTLNQSSTLNATWPRNAIDHFVLRKLHAAGLSPSKAADKRTLIRRVTFDLTGLPPTPREVNAFLADDSPDAYEKLVERLLASPHFGEKWARHWLDLVRYAETHGHEFDYPIRHAWRYRNYLIRAFNADVPYDQLIREHVAGDLLMKPRKDPATGTEESILGTGFWYFGEATHAPTDVRGDEALRIENQIDVFSKTFLALTVACARCHDHKFDPIPTTDYYALAGFLQSTRKDEARLDPGGKINQVEGRLYQLYEAGVDLLGSGLKWLQPVQDADVVAKYLLAAREACLTTAGRDEFPSDEAIAKAARANGVDAGQLKRWIGFLTREPTRRSDNHFAVWAALLRAPEAQFSRRLTEWTDSIRQQHERAKAAIEQGNLVAGMERSFIGWTNSGNHWKWNFGGQFEWEPTAGRLRFRRPHALHSSLFTDRLHETLRSPTFELTHDKLHLRMRARDVTVRLIIDGYQMEPFNGLLFGGTRLADVDTQGEWKWLTLGNPMYKGHKAYLEIVDDGDGEFALDAAFLTDGSPPPLDRMGFFDHLLLGRMERAKDPVDTPAEMARLLGGEWWLALNDWESHHESYAPETTVTLNALLDAGVVSKPPQLEALRQQCREIEKTLPEPIPILAAADGTGENEHVFIRGSHKNLGEIVPRRFLAALDGEAPLPLGPQQGSGRLLLAERMLAESNPFPARVMVNRLWHHLFGRGIVPSVDDFGVMGQPPSHPELLDWLAADFREHGWSIKHTIRQIVLSAAYRQRSGEQRAKSREPDPDSGSPLSALSSPLSIDPDNALLWRQNIRRLPAETVRDAVLAVSGRLDRTMGGPGVPVHLTPFMQGRGRPGQSGPLDGDGRRSLYLEVRRNFLTPMLTTFDFPQPFSTMGRRTVSNVPAQALMLMNNPFIIQQAETWATRLLAEHETTEQRIKAAFETAFAHPPTADQMKEAKDFLEHQANAYDTKTDDRRVWTDLCHVLFNVKAFIYLN